MERTKVDQPTAAPTRKVTAATVGAGISAGAVAAAAGEAISDLAAQAATLSPWLAWLGGDAVQALTYGAAGALGALVAGYVIRDRANVPT